MELIERIQARLDSLRWSWGDLARAMGTGEQRVNNWRTRGVPARELRNVEVALKLPRYALDDADIPQVIEAAVTNIRRARLKEWFANRTLPEKEKSYLSQLIGGKASFGEKAARRLEKDYGMPSKHLDKPLDQKHAALLDDKAAAIDGKLDDHAELLEAWVYLLPDEKEAIMEQIRPMAAHNRAVLEHYAKP